VSKHAGAIEEQPYKYKLFYLCADPATEPLPGPWAQSLRPFLALLLRRILRPDKVLPEIAAFVGSELGQAFTVCPSNDLRTSCAHSSADKPIVLILSPGADPMASLFAFAQSQKAQLDSVSLGQDQGAKAQALIERARQEVQSLCSARRISQNLLFALR
jgi:dynein heavy chain